MSEKIEVMLIDAGNTSIKSAEVINGNFLNKKMWKSVVELRGNYQTIPKIISSVRGDHNSLKKLFHSDTDIILDHNTKIPIQIDYHTLETLGVDRIALAVGANYLFPQQHTLIVDLGTCVTMDVIDKESLFRGGAISLGLTMRMKAMAHFTSVLPDISSDWKEIVERNCGKSTKESLLNGSYKGLINEINGTIETISHDFSPLNVILTGGDAHFFDSRIKAHIFAGSKIVEMGLYRIWKYQ